MNLDQLKLIGHLDQLKKHNILTEEEYDTARERVLNTENSPVSPTQVKPAGNKNAVLGGLLIAVVLLAGSFLYQGLFSKSTHTEDERDEMRESEAHEKAYKRQLKSSPPESPFNPDVQQSSSMLTIVNRNTLDYKNCELTLNDKYKAKVPLIDKGDTYILTYDKLYDDEGTIFNPRTTQIVEFMFYCKDYNGHSDIISYERK
jgi:hypothetical protein